jgi:UDP-N-acetyl-2-amino-2-deoxyglucuronate dehydrogenase
MIHVASAEGMSMPRQRLGIIGLGMAVTPHAKSLLDLQDRIEVVHAFSPSEARRHAFAERYPFPLTNSLDDVLSDRSLDAVLILTPPNTHLDLVRRAGGRVRSTRFFQR